jgi:hypothetical protein
LKSLTLKVPLICYNRETIQQLPSLLLTNVYRKAKYRNSHQSLSRQFNAQKASTPPPNCTPLVQPQFRYIMDHRVSVEILMMVFKYQSQIIVEKRFWNISPVSPRLSKTLITPNLFPNDRDGTRN